MKPLQFSTRCVVAGALLAVPSIGMSGPPDGPSPAPTESVVPARTGGSLQENTDQVSIQNVRVVGTAIVKAVAPLPILNAAEPARSAFQVVLKYKAAPSDAPCTTVEPGKRLVIQYASAYVNAIRPDAAIAPFVSTTVNGVYARHYISISRFDYQNGAGATFVGGTAMQVYADEGTEVCGGHRFLIGGFDPLEISVSGYTIDMR